MAAQRVLVIEDDPDTQQMLMVILRAEGYDVLSAGSGPLGLELLRKMGPDLVILDWMLPGWLSRMSSDSPATSDVHHDVNCALP